MEVKMCGAFSGSFCYIWESESYFIICSDKSTVPILHVCFTEKRVSAKAGTYSKLWSMILWVVLNKEINGTSS